MTFKRLCKRVAGRVTESLIAWPFITVGGYFMLIGWQVYGKPLIYDEPLTHSVETVVVEEAQLIDRAHPQFHNPNFVIDDPVITRDWETASLPTTDIPACSPAADLTIRVGARVRPAKAPAGVFSQVGAAVDSIFAAIFGPPPS